MIHGTFDNSVHIFWASNIPLAMRLRIALRWPSHSVSHDASYPLPVLLVLMALFRLCVLPQVASVDFGSAVEMSRNLLLLEHWICWGQWEFLGISSRLNVEISAGGMVKKKSKNAKTYVCFSSFLRVRFCLFSQGTFLLAAQEAYGFWVNRGVIEKVWNWHQFFFLVVDRQKMMPIVG